MWPDRRLIDLFDIEHPLVLAPMAGLGTAILAAAVCAGGGPDFPLPLAELAALRAKAEPHGSSDFTPLWAGQSAALGCELAARELTDRLVRQALERFRQLGSRPKN